MEEEAGDNTNLNNNNYKYPPRVPAQSPPKKPQTFLAYNVPTEIPKETKINNFNSNNQQSSKPKTKTFLAYNTKKNPQSNTKTTVKSSQKINKIIEAKPFFQHKTKIIPSPIKRDSNEEMPNKVTTPIGKPDYRFAGKESLLELIKKILPKWMYPTKRLAIILAWVFGFAVILGLLMFWVDGSWDKMLDPDSSMNVSIKVGIPMDFLKFNLLEPEKSPLRVFGFIVDLLVFLILAYAIDICINYFHAQAKSLTKEERGICLD
jgi:hypothetical protein